MCTITAAFVFQSTGCSTLHVAIREGADVSVCEALIKAGADIEAEDDVSPTVQQMQTFDHRRS